MYAILALAGCSILFFGYDAGVMALVNTNPDYLSHVGVSGGSNGDAAVVGGLVSLWLGGFGIGSSLTLSGRIWSDAIDSGAILVGIYADKIGRLKTVQLGYIWAMVGAIMQASAMNSTCMAFARLIGWRRMRTSKHDHSHLDL